MTNTIKQINETIKQLERAKSECFNICNSIEIYATNNGREMNNQERERWARNMDAFGVILHTISELEEAKQAIIKIL